MQRDWQNLHRLPLIPGGVTAVFLTIDTELMWRHHAEGLDRAEIYARSLDVNINLWWGLIMLGFGLVMFVLGKRGTKMKV